MSEALQDAPDTDAPQEIPAYIMDAAEAAGEWWARSDRDPRIKFQPAVVMKLLTGLREGNHYEPACALAGVSYRQFREWMNRAEDDGPDTPFGRVAAAVKLAEAEAEAESVRYVRAASRDPRFWAAGMTFLERRHPDRWRRPDSAQQVNVNVGVALGVQVSDEQRRAIVPTIEVKALERNPPFAPDLSLSAGAKASPQPVDSKA